MIVNDVDAKPAWDEVDVTCDFARFVAGGRTLSGVAVVVSEGDGALTKQDLALNGTVAGARLAVGTPGVTYALDFRGSFANGTRETVRVRMKVVP